MNLRHASQCAAVLLILMLTGCGSSTARIETTTLILSEDGRVSAVVVEPFDAPQYDFEELKAQIEEEVSAFNLKAGSDAITVGELKEEEAVVRMTMEYEDMAAYAAFNNVLLQTEGNRILFSEKLRVRTWEKIESVSEGVTMVSEKEADATAASVLPVTITLAE